jgi:GDPmannose 4,6-dehydratase
MSARTALITGAAGQDGLLLGQHLQALGYRVVGVVREKPAAGRSGDNTQFITADLCDQPTVQRLLDRWRPDEIYHLAAYHHSSEEGASGTRIAARQLMVETNFNITRTIAFAMLESGAPASLVFAGSSQMYTASGPEDSVDEGTPRRPCTFYGHVKSWSAELLAQLRADFGLRAGTGILFNHESTLRRRQFVSRKATHAAAAIKAGQPGRLEIGNTRARVDWCSAKDVVRALHLMATAPIGNDYVVASGQLHSVADLLDAAFGYFGLDWREHTTVLAEREEPALRGNPALIESSLGWRRTLSFTQTIQEMAEHDLRLLSGGAA